ncbi:hypothetical protein EDB85DRAFT_1855214 [Lactarius pseudohatsudake]|nr:hypothetical protein EDB85DRAFT_1855214 [Lactarius pseudohatsudake]
MSLATQSETKKACKKGSLPPGAEENNQFCGVFIPTYKWWVGTQGNPWVIPDDVAISVLQTIWDAIYKDVPWTVNANDCVFERHLCEWCSSFKCAADIMLEQFFKCKENCEKFKSYGSHQELVKNMLEDCKFVWVKVGKSIGLDLKALCAPFILQVFATHLNCIVGAKDVPSLEATSIDGDTSAVAKYPPKGALAPAIAAVKRTLQLWADGEMKALDSGGANLKKQANKPIIKALSKLNPATGVVSNAALKFSVENWGTITINYFTSIDRMKSESLEDIMQLATPFMSPAKSRCQALSYGLCSLTEDGEDIHICLMED